MQDTLKMLTSNQMQKNNDCRSSAPPINITEIGMHWNKKPQQLLI